MHTVGRYLADLAEGQDIIDLSDTLPAPQSTYLFYAVLGVARVLGLDCEAQTKSDRITDQ
jgi:hypothetical protein